MARKVVWLSFILVSIALGLFGACSSPMTKEAPATAAVTEGKSIVDAAHGDGASGFYFLPPMVPQPAFGGSFDGTLSPVVEILKGLGPDRIATYTLTSGPGSETLRVSSDGEHYIVNWHAKDFGLDPASMYRILVSIGGTELGHADVDLVSNGAELRNVLTQENIGLVNGRTLPIKFRIEGRGAPVAFAEASTTEGSRPLMVDFSGSSSGGWAPYCWAWDLDGDGAFDDSAEQDPTFVYGSSGTYSATLRVTDSAGHMASSPPIVIVVGNPALAASATASQSNGYPPLAVGFTGTASGGTAPYGWAWDLDGDGLFDDSTEQNPSFAYVSPGSREVRLRVTDAVNMTAYSSSLAISVYAHSIAVYADGRPPQGDAPFLGIFHLSFDEGNPPYAVHVHRDGMEDFDFQAYGPCVADIAVYYATPGQYAVWATITDADGCIGYSDVIFFMIH